MFQLKDYGNCGSHIKTTSLTPESKPEIVHHMFLIGQALWDLAKRDYLKQEQVEGFERESRAAGIPARVQPVPVSSGVEAAVFTCAEAATAAESDPIPVPLSTCTEAAAAAESDPRQAGAPVNQIENEIIRLGFAAEVTPALVTNLTEFGVDDVEELGELSTEDLIACGMRPLKAKKLYQALHQ